MLYGTHVDPATGATWLILDYLDGGVRVTRTTEPGAMEASVDWIGRFHAVNEASLARAAMPFLNRYDAGYYLGWARRTGRFAGRLRRRFGWLPGLCERFEEAVAHLLAKPPTVIHGEYYPDTNVLIRAGVIYPVDWESAAIAAGEIDLAALSEKWPADVVRQWELRYRQARWPDGAPAHFERTLAAARLYLQLRWLGERPEETTAETNLWRYEELKAAGERFGLI
jgi:thiamine kinase-like enzyme